MGLALYSSQYNFYLQGKIICSCLSQHQTTKMRALLTRHAVLHLAFYFVLINLEESSMSKNRAPPVFAGAQFAAKTTQQDYPKTKHY